MKDSRKKAKKVLILGAIVGGFLGLTVSLLMDLLYADALHGTWRDAIASDFNNLFSISISPESFIAFAVYVFILLILTSFGAFIGILFTFVIYRFFIFLGSNEG